MIDGIINENGNSRYLRSVANLLTLYPTYEDFAAALVAGTLPIDLAGINEDGWATLGTALNKANLMSDATAALLGGVETVDEGLAAIAPLVPIGTTGLPGQAITATENGVEWSGLTKWELVAEVVLPGESTSTYFPAGIDFNDATRMMVKAISGTFTGYMCIRGYSTTSGTAMVQCPLLTVGDAIVFTTQRRSKGNGGYLGMYDGRGYSTDMQSLLNGVTKGTTYPDFYASSTSYICEGIVEIWIERLIES